MTTDAVKLMLRANALMNITQLELVRDIVTAARANALEEAAKVADAYDPRCDVCPRGVAAAIRALINNGEKND